MINQINFPPALRRQVRDLIAIGGRITCDGITVVVDGPAEVARARAQTEADKKRRAELEQQLPDLVEREYVPHLKGLACANRFDNVQKTAEENPGDRHPCDPDHHDRAHAGDDAFMPGNAAHAERLPRPCLGLKADRQQREDQRRRQS